MFPAAPEHLAEDRVVRLLQSLWLLVETRQVPLDDGLHARERIVLGDGPAREKQSAIGDVTKVNMTSSTG